MYAITNSTGQYTLNTNLPTDTYNVTLLFPTGYLTNTVSGIAVTAGQTATANIALNPSGVISGTVTSTTGQQISDVSVYAFTASFTFFGSATTNSSGQYEINSNLGTGAYTVEASYDSQPPSIYPTQVNLVAGATQSGINFQFTVTPTGSISGQVTSSAGGPVVNAYVEAQGASGSGSDYTDINGNFHNWSRCGRLHS